MEEKTFELTIRDLIDMIVPKLWLIAAFSVLCAGIMGVYSSFFVKDTYTTSAQFYVHTGSATNSDLTFSKSLVPVYIAAYESDNFCNELRNEIISQKPQYSNKVSNSALKGMLSFSQDGAVPIFDVKVTSQDKNLALTVAEAVVKLSHSEDPTELPAINSYVPHSSADLELYRTPILPSTPNDKNVARNAVIGFFAAAVVATAGVVVAGLLDVTIRDKKKLESHLDVPVLGVIPRNEVGKVETKKNGNA